MVFSLSTKSFPSCGSNEGLNNLFFSTRGLLWTTARKTLDQLGPHNEENVGAEFSQSLVDVLTEPAESFL